MDGLTVALTTYAITIIISLLTACLIRFMVFLLTHFNKKEEIVLNNDVEIAAVIAIAQNKNK